MASAALVLSAACTLPEFGVANEAAAGSSTTTAATGGGGATGAGGATGGASTGQGGHEDDDDPDAPVPPAEDCTNGKDDDDDGEVDCEDAACSAFECLAPAPPEWDGPVVFLPGQGGVGCVAPWPEELVAGMADLEAKPATCKACSCSPAQGMQCPAAGEVLLHQTADCAGTATKLPSGGACADLQNVLAVKAVVAVPVKATGGSCTPAGGGVVEVPPAAFAVAARVCGGAALGKGCAGGGVCAPRPSVGRLCIRAAGDVPCPPGPFLDRHYFSESGEIEDGRGCQACGCSAPSAACSSTTTLHEEAACGAGVTKTVTHDASCTPAALDVGSIKLASPGVPEPATCAPGGGTPIGTVTAKDGSTFCCAQ